MKNKKIDLIISSLDKLESYRGARLKDNLNSLVFSDCMRIHKETYTDHCGFTLGLTVSRLNLREMSIKESWLDISNLLRDTLKVLHKTNLVCGIVLGVEMYQKNKTGVNTRAFKPHMHLAVLCYNDFLNLSQHTLEWGLRDLKLDYRLTRLNTAQDSGRWIAYCIKGRNDESLQEIAKALGFGCSVLIWNVPEIEVPSLRHLGSAIGVKVISENSGSGKDLIVSCRREEDDGLQAGSFIKAQCLHSGIGVFKNTLCIRKPGSLFTWTRYSTVPGFVAKLTEIQANAKFLNYLRNAGALNSDLGLLGKNSTFKVYPTIDYKLYCWEFKDGWVYNGQEGVLLRGELLFDRFISCGKFYNFSFDDLPEPLNLLKIVGSVCKQEEQSLFLVRLACLWHELGWYGFKRKDLRALLIFGEPNSLKTTLIKKILSAALEDVLIHEVGQYGDASGTGRFTFSLLKDVSVGVVFVDDIKSSSGLLKYPGRLTNFLDGRMTVEQKYHDCETLDFKGGVALTSNHDLSKLLEADKYDKEDLNSLEQRIETIHFHKRVDGLWLSKEIANISESEVASFVVFCNALFLKGSLGINARTPLRWEKTTKSGWTSSDASQDGLSVWSSGLHSEGSALNNVPKLYKSSDGLPERPGFSEGFLFTENPLVPAAAGVLVKKTKKSVGKGKSKKSAGKGGIVLKSFQQKLINREGENREAVKYRKIKRI